MYRLLIGAIIIPVILVTPVFATHYDQGGSGSEGNHEESNGSSPEEGNNKESQESGSQAGPSSDNTLFESNELDIPIVPVGSSLVQSILNIVFLIIGALATVFIIVGGFQYIVSAGSSEKIQKAKNTVLYSAVGLLVSVLALTVVNFVINKLPSL